MTSLKSTELLQFNQAKNMVLFIFVKDTLFLTVR